MKEPNWTYFAVYKNKTGKIGFSRDVFARVRNLGGSSRCLVCIRAEHTDRAAAIIAEDTIKKICSKYIITDAQCQEWVDLKQKGFLNRLLKAIKKINHKGLSYSQNVGYKSSTSWENVSEKNVRKLVG